MSGIPPFDPENAGGCSLGFAMIQNRFSVPLWSWMIEHERPARFIELGSGRGGFTCCLAIAMRNYGGRVYAFDKVEPPPEILAWWSTLPVSFYRLDVFSSEGVTKISHITQDHGATIVLCDGGSRVREFTEFAKYLKSGDIIAAHDYKNPKTWPFSEFTEVDAQEPMDHNGLTRIPWPQIHQAGWFAARKL